MSPDTHDDDSITNDERASWAEVALLAYGQRTGVVGEQVGDDEDPFLVLSDLLADLAHWCDRHGVDLPSTLAHATRHYHAETGGEGRQLQAVKQRSGKAKPDKAKPGKSARRRRPPQGCVRYLQVKGKMVDFIELCVSSDYRCVSVRFQDKTDFTVEIDPCLTFQALHSDWKTGNQRVLKSWPTVRSEES